MEVDGMEDLDKLLAGSGRKADLLGVIQKHIAQTMEADKETQNQMKAKMEELNRTKNLCKQLQTELIATYQRVEEMETMNRSTTEELIRRYESSIDSLTARATSAETKLAVSEETCKRNEIEIKELIQRNSEGKTVLDSMKSQFEDKLGKLESSLTLLTKELDFHKSTSKTLSSELESTSLAKAEATKHAWHMTDQLKAQKMEIMKYEASTLRYENEVQKLTATLAMAQKEKEAYVALNTKISDDLVTSNSLAKKLERELHDVEDAMQRDSRNAITALEAELAEMTIQLEAKDATCEESRAENDTLSRKYKELQQVVEELEEMTTTSDDRLKNLKEKSENDLRRVKESAENTSRQLEARLRQAEDVMKGLQALTQTKEAEVQAANNGRDELMALTRGLQGQRDELDTTLSKVQLMYGECQERLRESELRFQALQQASMASSKQIETQQLEMQRLTSIIIERNRVCDKLQNDCDEACKARDIALSTASAMEANAKELEAALNHAAESEMKQGRAAGSIRSQLKRVSDELDVCRARLAESEDTRKSMIDELKSSTASAAAAQDALRELENRIEPLERDSRRLAEVTNRLKSYDSSERFNTAERVKAVAMYENASREKEEMAKELSHVQELLRLSKIESTEKIRQMSDTNAELSTSFSKLKQSNNELEMQCKRLTSQSDRLKVRLEEEEGRSKSTGDASKELVTLTRRIADLANQNEELDSALAKAQGEGDRLHDQIAALKAELAASERSNAALRSSTDAQGRELRAMISRLNEAEHTIEEIQTAFASERSNLLEAHDGKIKVLEETLETLTTRMNDADIQSEQLLSETARLKTELTLKDKELHDALSDLARMKSNGVSNGRVGSKSTGEDGSVSDTGHTSLAAEEMISIANEKAEALVREATKAKESVEKELRSTKEALRNLAENEAVTKQQCVTLETILRNTQNEREEATRALEELQDMKDREVGRLRRRNEVLSAAVESLTAGHRQPLGLAGASPMTSSRTSVSGSYYIEENNADDVSKADGASARSIDGTRTEFMSVQTLLQSWNNKLLSATTSTAKTPAFSTIGKEAEVEAVTSMPQPHVGAATSALPATLVPIAPESHSVKSTVDDPESFPSVVGSECTAEGTSLDTEHERAQQRITEALLRRRRKGSGSFNKLPPATSATRSELPRAADREMVVEDLLLPSSRADMPSKESERSTTTASYESRSSSSRGSDRPKSSSRSTDKAKLPAIVDAPSVSTMYPNISRMPSGAEKKRIKKRKV